MQVVVGGTSGIGEGIAMRLAQANANVLIVGRSTARGSEVLQQMRRVQAAGSGASHSRSGGGDSPLCDFLACDVSLLANVQRACAEIAAQHPVVDLLVLTPGIATLAGRNETSEGLDTKLAVHYYARIAFIECLGPQLAASKDARVLSVLSAGVHSAYRLYREDPELRQHYSLPNAANAAGFYNDLAADFLSQAHAPNVRFVHAAPGIVATRWGSEMPWWLRWLVRALIAAGRSKEDCAEYMCSALLGKWPSGAAAGAAEAGRSGGGSGAESGEAVGQGFYLMRPDGGPAKQTPQHAEALAFVRAHTAEVMARLLTK